MLCKARTPMESTETKIGYHWSLTLLGIGLIILFTYYGESVLAVLFFAVLLSFMPRLWCRRLSICASRAPRLR